MNTLKNSLRLVLVSSGLILAAPAPVNAVETPVRLYEIAARRIVRGDAGSYSVERGLLNALGQFRVTSAATLVGPVSYPDEALNRPLISFDAWSAYGELGTVATADFVLAEPDPGYAIGNKLYYPVIAHPDPKYNVGDLANVSTRAVISPGGEPMIAGFIVENQSRRVLIRAVGPTLANFGVSAPLADPYITVQKAGSPITYHYNNDWNERYDADEIEALTASIGAFPLPRGSKDAAYLVELPPGAYTVHVTSFAEGNPGTVLAEVYVLP